MGKLCSKCLHTNKSINKHTENTKPTASNSKVMPMNSFILPGELQGFISHGRKIYLDVQRFYELGPILGHGSFGNVRLATLKNSKTTQQFAVKSIPKAKISKEIGLLVNELKILKMVDHPNIIKLYEVYEDDRYIHLVMEYCSGGELFERIIDHGTFSEYEAANLMAKLFQAINHLHSLRISHRDLKPENVLYTSKEPNADIKLVDFGLSSKFGKDKMHTIVGTCYYVAPEVLKQKYGPKCDVWSLGVIMYLLLAGKPPFVGKSKVEVFYKIRKSEYSLEGNVWDSISEEAKDLIRKLLTKSQKRRLSAVQALEHPWFKKFENATYNNELDATVLRRLQKFKASSKLRHEMMRIFIKYLSSENITVLNELFRKLDVHHTGYIMCRDLQEAIKSIGVDIPPEEIERVHKTSMMARCEELGRINYTDFLISALDMKDQNDEDTIWTAFKYFDQENSGHITPRDIQDALRKAGKEVDTVDVDNMMRDAGMTNLNYITFEEFSKIIKGEI